MSLFFNIHWNLRELNKAFMGRYIKSGRCIVNKKYEISSDHNLNIEKEKIIPVLEEKVTVGKQKKSHVRYGLPKRFKSGMNW
jgi:hypothetical protein